MHLLPVLRSVSLKSIYSPIGRHQISMPAMHHLSVGKTNSFSVLFRLASSTPVQVQSGVATWKRDLTRALPDEY